MKRNLLLTPGPTVVPPQLCEVLGRPIIHHRTPQFQDILKETEEGLKYIFQTTKDVYLLAGSGSAAMEAAVCNLLSPGEQALTVESGKFGERWTELCKAYGIPAHVLEIEWGTAVTAEHIAAELKKDPAIKAVFITLCETSTAVTPNIEAIGKVVKDSNAVLVVDAVSGLGVIDLPMDKWHVDVVVSGSHKGLMLPPGVALISVSDKAWKLVEASKSPRYYFDLRKCRKAMADTDTPFTPAIGIVIALNESIKLIQQQGLNNLFAHYERLAKGARAGGEAIGMAVFTREDSRSNALTAFNVPDGVDGKKLVKIMRDVHGITFAGGQGHLTGKIVRMAHMGCLDEYDMLAGIACLEKCLKQLGHKFDMGAGVAAAQKYFNG